MSLAKCLSAKGFSTGRRGTFFCLGRKELKFHNLDLREIFFDRLLEKNIEHISCEIVVEDRHLTEMLICLSNMKESKRKGGEEKKKSSMKFNICFYTNLLSNIHLYSTVFSLQK